MTKLCSAAYFKSTPHYSSPNFTYVEDQQLLHNIVKSQLDIFGYSSVSELQSFPTLTTLLQGFWPRVYGDRKVTTVCEFEFRLNCKQHVMIHQGTYIIALIQPSAASTSFIIHQGNFPSRLVNCRKRVISSRLEFSLNTLNFKYRVQTV